VSTHHPNIFAWLLTLFIELIIGQHNTTKPRTSKVAFTKWCPAENGVKTFENAEAAVDLALRRMNQDKIDLLQCK
jgi:aryl-alcohol dehydrogenase-like predicted oxidoreductase